MIPTYKAYYRSKIGLIEIVGNEHGILSVDFVEEKSVDDTEVHPCLKECVKQIDEYFRGIRKGFTLTLKMQGTDFQKRIWNLLKKIPYGKTVSYLDIASAIGNRKAVRAVGGANGKNKIAIIIPCHRVTKNNGMIGGYGGGVWRKEWLLNHEKRVSTQ